MLRFKRSSVPSITAAVLIATMIAGCDSTDWAEPGVSGYWKGEMLGAAIADLASASASEARDHKRPRRILLRLQEKQGVVNGVFAHSSDAIAFRRLDSASVRNVSTHAVTGTREGQRIRMSFSGDNGDTFDVDAIYSNKLISGTYTVTYDSSGQLAGTVTNGKFEVERY